MNVIFFSVDMKEEIFSIESPSLDEAYHHVEDYFGEMAESQGNNDFMNFAVVDKKPNVWKITNSETGGTYLLYIKSKS